MKSILAGVIFVILTLILAIGGSTPFPGTDFVVHEHVPEEVKELVDEEIDVFLPSDRCLSRPVRLSPIFTAYLYRNPYIPLFIRPPKSNA